MMNDQKRPGLRRDLRRRAREVDVAVMLLGLGAFQIRCPQKTVAFISG